MTSVVSSLCTRRLRTLKAKTQKDTIPSTAEPPRWGSRSQGSTVTSITLKVSEWAQTAPPTLKCHPKEHENALCPSEEEREKRGKTQEVLKIIHTLLVSECQNTLNQRSKPSKNTPLSHLTFIVLLNRRICIKKIRTRHIGAPGSFFRELSTSTRLEWPNFDTPSDFTTSKVTQATAYTIERVFNSKVKRLSRYQFKSVLLHKQTQPEEASSNITLANFQHVFYLSILFPLSFSVSTLPIRSRLYLEERNMILSLTLNKKTQRDLQRAGSTSDT